MDDKLTLAAPPGLTGQVHAGSGALYQIIEGKVEAALQDVGDFLRLGFRHVVDEVEAVIGGAATEAETKVEDAAETVEAKAEPLPVEAKAAVTAEVKTAETVAVAALNPIAETLTFAAPEQPAPVNVAAPATVETVETAPVAPAPAPEQPAAPEAPTEPAAQ